MKRNIVIIGGGISGLSLLHYLKQRHASSNNAAILLLEKNDRLGGTIQSISKNGCVFETGPNGFLDSKPRTLALAEELGLTNRLVKANEESKIRYLSVNNRLHALPTNPKSFLSSGLLNPMEKARVLGEFFVPKGGSAEESVYDFGKRRLGEKFAQVFLDPMVSGIYGGDAQQSNLKAVFPKIYALEEEYGSLFKAMIKRRKNRTSNGGGAGGPAGTLTSFRAGVAEIIEAAGERYKEHIRCGQDVRLISKKQDQYSVETAGGQQYMADELYICSPAYSAGPMVRPFNSQLAKNLEKIRYAPMAVVGLVYPLKYFSQRPTGYGYLIPSFEQKEVLGVLFESNIFPHRSSEGQMMFRVMIGGARHPNILEKSKDGFIRMASDEIKALMAPVHNGDTREAQDCFFTRWEKAIPQYDLDYCDAVKNIEDQLQRSPHLHLVANYLKGVSLNDCIENSYQAAQS